MTSKATKEQVYMLLAQMVLMKLCLRYWDLVRHLILSIFFLLSFSGASVAAVDPQGRTPLHIASEKGYGIICMTLLKAGAEVDVLDKEENTPFTNIQRKLSQGKQQELKEVAFSMLAQSTCENDCKMQ